MILIRNSNQFHERIPVSGDSFFLDNNYRVRVVSLNDSGKIERGEWIRQIAPFSHFFDYRESDSFAFSTAEKDFDIIMLSGCDASRIRSIYRKYEPILRSKVAICVTQDSSAKFRAEVLNAGLDEVFDTVRTSPQEAIARLNVITRRYASLLETHRTDLLIDSMLDGHNSLQSLSEREYKLMTHLVERQGKPVSYTHLREAMSRDYELINKKHLHVIVWGLRKKLRRGVEIKASTGTGYYIAVNWDAAMSGEEDDNSAFARRLRTGSMAFAASAITAIQSLIVVSAELFA